MTAPSAASGPWAACTRQNLGLIYATRAEMQQLAEVQKLVQEHHSCQLPGTPPPSSVVWGLLARFRLDGAYHLRQVEGMELAQDGTGRPLFVMQAPQPGASPDTRQVPLHSLSGTNPLSGQNWEALGRGELAALAAYWEATGHGLPLAEAAAAAWRKQVALRWQRQHSSAPAAERVRQVPVLLGVLQDPNGIAQAQQTLTASESPAHELAPAVQRTQQANWESSGSLVVQLGQEPAATASPAAMSPSVAVPTPRLALPRLNVPGPASLTPPPAFEVEGMQQQAKQQVCPPGGSSIGGFGEQGWGRLAGDERAPAGSGQHVWAAQQNQGGSPSPSPRRLSVHVGVEFDRGAGGYGSLGRRGRSGDGYGGCAPAPERGNASPPMCAGGFPSNSARHEAYSPSDGGPRGWAGYDRGLQPGSDGFQGYGSRGRSRSRSPVGRGAGAEPPPPLLAPVLVRHFRRSFNRSGEEWDLTGREINVTGLPLDATERELRGLLESAGGTVLSVKITNTGDNRGEVAFVDMGTAPSAAATIEQLQGAQLRGSRLFLRGNRKEMERVRRAFPRECADAERAAAAAAERRAWQQRADLEETDGHPRGRSGTVSRPPPPRSRSPSPRRGPRSRSLSQERRGHPAAPRSGRALSPSRSPVLVRRYSGGGGTAALGFWDPVWELEAQCVVRLKEVEGRALPVMELLRSASVPADLGVHSDGDLLRFLARRPHLFSVEEAGSHAGAAAVTLAGDGTGAFLNYKRRLLQYIADHPPRVELRRLEAAVPPPRGLPAEARTTRGLGSFLATFLRGEVWQQAFPKGYRTPGLHTVELAPFAAGPGGPRFSRVCRHFQGTAAASCPDGADCELPHAPPRAFR